MALIADKGPVGFTIAEAGASRAFHRAPPTGISATPTPCSPRSHNVDSTTSPAHHGAWNEGRPDPVRALEAVGRAYLSFGATRPAYYAAMFEARTDVAAHPGLSSASERAFAVLRDATERLAAALPPQRRPPPLMMALHIWSMAHGIASLFVRADPSRRKLPMSPEELLEAGVLLYLQSFGLAGGRL